MVNYAAGNIQKAEFKTVRVARLAELGLELVKKRKAAARPAKDVAKDGQTGAKAAEKHTSKVRACTYS